MTKASIIGWGTAAAVLCLAGFGLFRADDPGRIARDQKIAQEASARAKSERIRKERESILARLQSGERDNKVLVSLVGGISECGLGENEEILAIYASALASMDSHQLVEVLNNWENTSGRARLMGYAGLAMVNRKDPAFFRDVIFALPESESRNGMLKRVARDSAFFAPEEIDRMLDGFPEGDRANIGEGLSYQLDKLTSQQRYETAGRYFSDCDDPLILNSISASVMRQLVAEDPENAAKWSLEQPGESVQGGDMALLEGLGGKHTQTAIDFVNTLIERDELPRAATATEIIARTEFGGNPEGAIDWAMTLPPELKNREKILYQFLTVLDNKDPAKAAAVVDKLGDENIRKMLKVIKKSKG